MNMNIQQLLSGILAIIMALTGVAAGLPDTGSPVSVDLSVGVEGDISALAASGAVSVSGGLSPELLSKLLSGLAIRLSGEKDTAQLQILLKDTPVAGMTVKKDGNSWAAVSDLFPQTKLTLTDSTVQMMLAAMAPSSPIPGMNLSSLNLSSLDPQAMVTELAPYIAEIQGKITAAIGTPEAGEFEVDGVKYIIRTPINLTTKELLQMVLTLADKILSSEQISSLLSQLGPQFAPAGLKETLEALEKKDDSELPVLTSALFTAADASLCYEAVMEKDNEQLRVTVAQTGKVMTIRMDVLSQMTGIVTVDQEAKTFDADIAITANNQNVRLLISGAVKDDKSSVRLSVSPAEGVAISLNMVIGKDAPVFEPTEDLNEIAFEKLAAEPQGGELTQAFTTDITTGMQKLLVKVMQAMPEFALLLLPQPQKVESQPQVTEPAPAEPVEVEESVPADEVPAA